MIAEGRRDPQRVGGVDGEVVAVAGRDLEEVFEAVKRRGGGAPLPHVVGLGEVRVAQRKVEVVPERDVLIGMRRVGDAQHQLVGAHMGVRLMRVIKRHGVTLCRTRLSL